MASTGRARARASEKRMLEVGLKSGWFGLLELEKE